MRIYWTLNGIPGWSALTRKEQGQVWRDAYLRAFRRWPIWAALLVPIGLGALAGQMAGVHYGPWNVGSMIGVGIGGGVFGFLANIIVGNDIRERLAP